MNISLSANPFCTTTFNELKVGDAFIVVDQYEVGAEITFEEVKALFEQASKSIFIKVIDNATGKNYALSLKSFVMFEVILYPVVKITIKNIELNLP